MDSRPMFWVAHLTKIAAAVSAVAVTGMAATSLWLQGGSVSDLQSLLPEVAISVIFAAFMILMLRIVRQIYLDAQGARERQEAAFMQALEKIRDGQSEDNGKVNDSLARLTDAFTEHEKHAAAASKAVTEASEAVKQTNAAVGKLVAELESTRPG